MAESRMQTDDIESIVYKKFRTTTNSIGTLTVNLMNERDRLIDYCGSGISYITNDLSNIIRNIEKCRKELVEEENTLRSIVDSVVRNETSAYGIISGEVITESSDNVSYVSSSEYASFGEFFEKILDLYYDSTGLTDKMISFIGKVTKNKYLGEISDYLGTLKIAEYFTDLIYSYKDFDITTSELLKIIDGSVDAFDAFADIVKSVCGFEDLKNLPKSLGVISWQKVVEWTPLVNVVFSTVIGWNSKYNEYAADGEFTTGEMCRMATYGAMKGLLADAGNIPYVGKVISLINGGADIANYDIADEITDFMFDSLDSIGDRAEEDMLELIRTNEDYCNWFAEASHIERMISYFSLYSYEMNEPIISIIHGQ